MVAGKRVKVVSNSFEEAKQLLETYDDYAVWSYPLARVIHDPTGRFAELTAGLVGYPEEVLQGKIKERYRLVRRQQASLAWALRRGQSYVFLDRLVGFLNHVLSLCFYLDGRPPVGHKWLLRGAFKTETGKRLRPLVFELFSNLGLIATLGGTYDTRSNPLYQLVSAIQETLLAAINEKGYANDPLEEG
jgi:hypothetical protein